ncbi:MAG: 2-C-methyl-D-erythritol 2,4-cyclodiphosphate synthase [Candidatus Methylacidiphilales bacterium]
MIRVGIGYDVHQFAEGRRMVLGGVEIPHHRGLSGHSDADVLIHAMADALLGALGLPDIGHFYPNTDVRWKDVPSTVFLHDIAEKISAARMCIGNLDSTVIAEEPKVLPHLAAMKKAVAEALHINPEQVGIKATTNETMGFIGRREGVAAMAVACLHKVEKL